MTADRTAIRARLEAYERTRHLLDPRKRSFSAADDLVEAHNAAHDFEDRAPADLRALLDDLDAAQQRIDALEAALRRIDAARQDASLRTSGYILLINAVLAETIGVSDDAG
jgi:hypothetical protein